MAKTITVSFDNDMPEEGLEDLREKIRKVLRGEAVPEAEVVGQYDPNRGGGSNVGSTPGVR
jgi:hypothetical protein